MLRDGAAGTFALGIHRRLETLLIDLDATLNGQLSGELEWKTERIMQAKRVPTRNDLWVPRDDFLELLHALLQGALEAIALDLDRLGDESSPSLQFGVVVAEHRDRNRSAFVQRRDEPYPACVQRRAADEPPENIAATLVGGGDAVGDAESCRTDVVRNDSLGQARRIWA